MDVHQQSQHSQHRQHVDSEEATPPQTQSVQAEEIAGHPSRADSSKSWQPGLVRKLFDKELDNHHEEALLLAQLAAQQLQHALQLQQHPVQGLCAWAESASQVIHCMASMHAPCSMRF